MSVDTSPLEALGAVSAAEQAGVMDLQAFRDRVEGFPERLAADPDLQAFVQGKATTPGQFLRLEDQYLAQKDAAEQVADIVSPYAGVAVVRSNGKLLLDIDPGLSSHDRRIMVMKVAAGVAVAGIAAKGLVTPATINQDNKPQASGDGRAKAAQLFDRDAAGNHAEAIAKPKPIIETPAKAAQHLEAGLKAAAVPTKHEASVKDLQAFVGTVSQRETDKPALVSAVPGIKPFLEELTYMLNTPDTAGAKPTVSHGPLADAHREVLDQYLTHPERFTNEDLQAITKGLDHEQLTFAASLKVDFAGNKHYSEALKSPEVPAHYTETVAQLFVAYQDARVSAITPVAKPKIARVQPQHKPAPDAPKPSHESAGALTTHQATIINGLVTSSADKDFIRKHLPQIEKIDFSKVPVNKYVLFEQSDLESRHGQSDLAVQANNYFGMKVNKDWTGPYVKMLTHEDYGHGLVPIMAKFKKYDSYVDSLNDYIKLITTHDRYAGAVQNHGSILGYLNGLREGGYFTDRHYATSIMALVRRHRTTELLAPPAPEHQPAPKQPEAPAQPEIPDAPAGTIDLGVHTGFRRVGAHGNGYQAVQERLVAIPGYASSSNESQPGNPYYIEGANGWVICDARVAQQVLDMFNDAKTAGLTLTAASSFRSMPHQTELWHENGEDRSVVAFPGRSNHQEGRAIDDDMGPNMELVASNYGTLDGGDPSESNPRIAPDSKVWRWLIANAWKYGFRQYYNEPWHFELDPNYVPGQAPVQSDLLKRLAALYPYQD